MHKCVFFFKALNDEEVLSFYSVELLKMLTTENLPEKQMQ